MLINTETKQYPLTDQQVREVFPNTTFAPHDWPPAPFAYVAPVDPPACDPITQDCTEGEPEQVGGVLRQTWVVSDVAPEIAAERLAAIREMTWGQIKAHRDAVKTQGVQVGGNWFHSDDSSRIQQLGLVMMGVNLPAGVQWKTMSGSFVTMTPLLAGQIFQATAARDMAVFAVAEQHRAGLYAAPDPSAYNWQTGWPASFTG